MTVAIRSTYDAVSTKIVRDLFDGSKHAPAKGKPIVAPKKKTVREAADAEVIAFTRRPSSFDAVTCPCCKRATSAPDLEIIIDHYRLPNMEACVLRAVWRGKGHPVMAERIFDLMYADDPDGGPSPGQMYSTFKVSLSRLRKRIRGSGVSIENVGYRRGYRLVIGEY